jgi:hypothetical protein
MFMLWERRNHYFYLGMALEELANMCLSLSVSRICKCGSTRARPDESGHMLFAEPGIIYLSLENKMDIKQLMAAAAIIIAAGSAFAQKTTTWVVPDAGFKSTMTRAEVRNELRTGDRRAWHHRDGEDMVYATGPQSRKDVRGEVIRTARARRTVSVNDIYFGE